MARPPQKKRRALTTSRTAAKVERGGDPDLAAALARALSRGPRDRVLAESVTHPLHSYPARMHPVTARELVSLVLGRAPGGAADGPPLRFLDPFCGGGTTLVEARFAGAAAVGVDINPLAVSIARAKTWTVAAPRRAELRRLAGELAAEAVQAGKAARRAGHSPEPFSAPRGLRPSRGPGAGGSTSSRGDRRAERLAAAERNRRLAGWFPPHVRRELEHLLAAVERIGERDRELGEVLLVLLSSILYKVSLRASDTDPSRVERRIARGAAARLFRQRAELLCAGLDDLVAAGRAPAGVVHHGDARKLAAVGISPATFHGAVTSPPYAGTYDYLEQHQLRLDFLGISERELGADEIGARRGFRGDSRSQRTARRRWQRDLAASLAEIERALHPGGLVAVMMGDSVAGGRAMFAEKELRDAAGGLELVAWAAQERPKLGALEHHVFADRKKREHVLLLRKS